MINPIDRRKDKALTALLGLLQLMFWFYFPFYSPWWSVARLPDTNLDHTSMCSRPGPRAHWSALETARDVTTSQARGGNVNNNADILETKARYYRKVEQGLNVEL